MHFNFAYNEGLTLYSNNNYLHRGHLVDKVVDCTEGGNSHIKHLVSCIHTDIRSYC